MIKAGDTVQVLNWTQGAFAQATGNYSGFLDHPPPPGPFVVVSTSHRSGEHTLLLIRMENGGEFYLPMARQSVKSDDCVPCVDVVDANCRWCVEHSAQRRLDSKSRNDEIHEMAEKARDLREHTERRYQERMHDRAVRRGDHDPWR